MLHKGTWPSGHGADGLMVGLDDLGGLFQPYPCHKGGVGTNFEPSGMFSGCQTQVVCHCEGEIEEGT